MTLNKKPYLTRGRKLALAAALLLIVGVLVFALSGVSQSDFRILASSPQKLPAGSASTATIVLSGRVAFRNEVMLAVTLPPGLVCNGESGIISTSVSLPSNSALSCTSDSDGSYVVTVVATGGGISRSTTLAFAFSQPSVITLSGQVSTPPGELPTRIDFIADKTYSAVVWTQYPSCGNCQYCSCHYDSVTIPNPGVYQVSIQWSFFGSSGQCLPGQLKLDQHSTAPIMQDYHC